MILQYRRKIIANIISLFKKIIRQNHQSKIIKIGEKIAKVYTESYWNESFFNIYKNGEFFIIQSIKSHVGNRSMIVFDVGANQGQWAKIIHQHHPLATVHCFEIVENTFKSLKNNLSLTQNIILNNFGLSDSHRQVEVTYFPKEDSGSSIQPLPWQIPSQKIMELVTTGDHYVETNNIDYIHFLKIDTEGHELFILRGFQKTIALGKITLIQFEYGWTYIPSRTTLGDIYDFLSPYGYRIGRIYPDGVKFKEYSLFDDEHFRMGNYLAVQSSALDLIQALTI
jgi:FkbM family methyltransferase